MNGEFYIGFCPSWRSLVVRDQDLKPNTKLVLLIIAEFMSGMGNMAWPSKDALADLSGLNLSQIDTALKTARELGYLQFHRATYGGDSGYEVRVPRNPATLDLWTPQPKGQSGPVFKIPGKNLLAEVLDATACHALIEALDKSRITHAASITLCDPEADSEEVEPTVQPAPSDPARSQAARPASRWS